MPKMRFRLTRDPGQARTSAQQTRAAVSALGQREAFSTYVGTWLAGIAIGVVLFGLVVGLGAFGSGSKVQPAAASTSDRNGTDLIGNAPISQREAIAQQGYAVFKAQGCVNCHQQGGYATTGQGPLLNNSGNSRDSTFIHSIVRWGYAPMPAYPAQLSQQQKDNGQQELSDGDLYKIVAYLQYIHDTPKQKPAWIK